jgi:mRNA interferase HigB
LHIISRKKLLDGARRHSGSEDSLDAWFRIAKNAQWKNLEDVRKTYPSADGVKVAGDKIYTVFNISGNSYRLIVKIEYRYQQIYVKHVLTHAEYDKEDWKK